MQLQFFAGMEARLSLWQSRPVFCVVDLLASAELADSACEFVLAYRFKQVVFGCSMLSHHAYQDSMGRRWLGCRERKGELPVRESANDLPAARPAQLP